MLQVNFVGKILGEKGANLQQLQQMTDCRIAILGRGSMRDKARVRLNYQYISEALNFLYLCANTSGWPICVCHYLLRSHCLLLCGQYDELCTKYSTYWHCLLLRRWQVFRNVFWVDGWSKFVVYVVFDDKEHSVMTRWCHTRFALSQYIMVVIGKC